MKKSVGIMAVLLGILFLVRPSFNMYQFSEALAYLCVRYWPVLLITFGVYLQSGNKKKKRR